MSKHKTQNTMKHLVDRTFNLDRTLDERLEAISDLENLVSTEHDRQQAALDSVSMIGTKVYANGMLLAEVVDYNWVGELPILTGSKPKPTTVMVHRPVPAWRHPLLVATWLLRGPKTREIPPSEVVITVSCFYDDDPTKNWNKQVPTLYERTRYEKI